jgi:hypothetical protein
MLEGEGSMMQQTNHETRESRHGSPVTHSGGHYRRLLTMTALHFGAMFVLMYAMVNVAGYAYPNLNQAYMAALMTASMVLIEVPVMRAMYPSARRNTLIMIAGAVALIGSFALIRMQVSISDREFLRSMIPHHAAAILMCERASISDPEVADLCRGIVASQQSEIDWMIAKLGRAVD